jgi:hypothetical protein
MLILLLVLIRKCSSETAAIYINSSVDGQLDIVADTEIQIAATTIDINGNADVSGTLGVTGAATFTGEIAANGGIALGVMTLLLLVCRMIYRFIIVEVIAL